MLRKLWLAMLIVGVAMVAVGCGDVCEDAGNVVKDCLDLKDDGNSDDDSEDAECTGTDKDTAQCIVDNEDAYCTYLKNPTTEDNPCD